MRSTTKQESAMETINEQEEEEEWTSQNHSLRIDKMMDHPRRNDFYGERVRKPINRRHVLDQDTEWL